VGGSAGREVGGLGGGGRAGWLGMVWYAYDLGEGEGKVLGGLHETAAFRG
jgi:hypothetical protein